MLCVTMRSLHCQHISVKGLMPTGKSFKKVKPGLTFLLFCYTNLQVIFYMFSLFKNDDRFKINEIKRMNQPLPTWANESVSESECLAKFPFPHKLLMSKAQTPCEFFTQLISPALKHHTLITMTPNKLILYL